MLYPIMNRSRSLIDLGGVWQFQLGDEKEPGDTWIEPQAMEMICGIITVGLITNEPWSSRHFCAEATDSVRYCVLTP